MSQLRFTGVQQHLRAMGKAKTKDAQKIEFALTSYAGVILRRALIYCPIETGALRESGRIEVSGKGFGARAQVIFGSETAHYALYVHEDMTKWHDPPTQAKFLERAARETRGTGASIVKRTIVSGTYRDYEGDISRIMPSLTGE